MPAYRKHVAVIGAGAGGLASARELIAEGHHVKVFEAGSQLGGTWVLNSAVEDDRLGQRDNRALVHSSMYDSLRTNLPRELMGFADLPFTPEHMQGLSVDARRYCGHVEVLNYLRAFAQHFSLEDCIHYGTRVVHVRPLCTPSASELRTSDEGQASSTGGWEVQTRHGGEDAPSTTVFDAVVVSNGHYSAPRVPDIAGFQTYPGVCEHSHNYRNPDAYRGQSVLIVGAHASGEDIARDVATTADRVVMSAKSWMKQDFADSRGPFGKRGNMYRRPWLTEMRPDGSLRFEDGSTLERVDVVMFCTGYHYSYPFLADGIVDTSRSHVRPLYQHLLTPHYRETLAFIGIPFKIVPFPQFELQARLVARLLSGRAQLPSTAAMQQWVDDRHRALAEEGVLDRHVHKLGGAQWEYNDWLAAMCGDDVPRTPQWRVALWEEARRAKLKYDSDQYRDVWEDERVMAAAHDAFAARVAPVAAPVVAVPAA